MNNEPEARHPERPGEAAHQQQPQQQADIWRQVEQLQQQLFIRQQQLQLQAHQHQQQQQQQSRPAAEENLLATVLQTVTRRPTQSPRLTTYDGSTNYRHFRALFNEVAQRQGWTEEEKTGQLINQLTGQAIEVVCALHESGKSVTFHNLDEILDQRYRRVRSEQQIEAEFHALRQEEHQSVFDFAQRVERLGREHFVGVDERFRQKQMVRAFHKGLHTSEARQSVKFARAKTLNEAMEAVSDAMLFADEPEKGKKARCAHVTTEDFGNIALTTRQAKLPQAITAQPSATLGVHLTAPQEPWSERMAMTSTMSPSTINAMAPKRAWTTPQTTAPAQVSREDKERNRAPNEYRGRGRGRPRGRGNAARIPGGNSTCHLCTQPGHFARNCPYRNSPCMFCHQTGHLYTKCPTNYAAQQLTAPPHAYPTPSPWSDVQRNTQQVRTAVTYSNSYPPPPPIMPPYPPYAVPSQIPYLPWRAVDTYPQSHVDTLTPYQAAATGTQTTTAATKPTTNVPFVPAHPGN